MDNNKFLMFYRSIDTIVKAIKRLEMEYMREYGLRSVHLRCLIKIKDSGDGMTATRLSRECGMDKALTSRILRELCEEGFLETRAPGSARAYKKKYFLTEKSEKITSDINEKLSEYIVTARGDISEEDVASFYRVLFALEKNITEINSEKKGDLYGT